MTRYLQLYVRLLYIEYEQHFTALFRRECLEIFDWKSKKYQVFWLSCPSICKNFVFQFISLVNVKKKISNFYLKKKWQKLVHRKSTCFKITYLILCQASGDPLGGDEVSPVHSSLGRRLQFYVYVLHHFFLVNGVLPSVLGSSNSSGAFMGPVKCLFWQSILRHLQNILSPPLVSDLLNHWFLAGPFSDLSSNYLVFVVFLRQLLSYFLIRSSISRRTFHDSHSFNNTSMTIVLYSLTLCFECYLSCSRHSSGYWMQRMPYLFLFLFLSFSLVFTHGSAKTYECINPFKIISNSSYVSFVIGHQLHDLPLLYASI